MREQREELLQRVAEHARSILALDSPDDPVPAIRFCKGREAIDVSAFMLKYHQIRPEEEYFLIYNAEGTNLLYAVNVTADSVLTAASELMHKLAEKF